jgi:hypothetical protein
LLLAPDTCVARGENRLGKRMGRLGFEPRTLGLKVPCSAS